MSDQQEFRIMQRIGGLLYKKLNDELDVREQIALDEWLGQQDPMKREFFEDITDWEQIQEALQVMYSFDEEAAFRDIQKKIEVLNVASAPALPDTIEMMPRKIRPFRLFSVAAAVLVIIGGVIVFTLSKRKTEIALAPLSQRYKNDVAPGGNKAVLQLADGRTIVLDDAANGELAQQGGTKVIKLDNGQLSYDIGKGQTGTETNASPSFNAISTPRGGQYQIVLPDGSKVWLNAASTLKYPTSFSGKDRSVELQGEAYFQVTKNSSQPFSVKISRPEGQTPLDIEVLGTEFNVMAYADEADQQTTLINGAVKVSTSDKDLTLQPGQQARIKNLNHSPLTLIPTINTDEIVAWKKGLFQFRDATIQDIMRQAARWYDVEVVYNGNVDQQFIGTIPRQVNISTLLKILESTGWVHFTIEGKKITVSR